MAEESSKPKAAPKQAAAGQKDRAKDAPDLKPSDAEAPGPITPEHESGSWEQTLEEQEAREERREAREDRTGDRKERK